MARLRRGRTAAEERRATKARERKLQRVGIYQEEWLLSRTRWIAAWNPGAEWDAPGFCLMPSKATIEPHPYHARTRRLEPDVGAAELLEIAAELAMRGAPFPLIDAALLAIPAWRGLQVRGRLAHSPDGSWSPHAPADIEAAAAKQRKDTKMFERRRAADRDAGRETVETVRGFLRETQRRG